MKDQLIPIEIIESNKYVFDVIEGAQRSEAGVRQPREK